MPCNAMLPDMKPLAPLPARTLSWHASAVADPVLRLFWFHHAGGNGASYRSWQHLFPGNWQIVFIEYPGRGENAGLPAAHAMPHLAGEVLDSIAPLLDRPYAMFGHSMGSLVAFAVARLAQERGLRQPFWFGASGRHPPHVTSGSRFFLHKLSDPALSEVLTELGGNGLDHLEDPAERAQYLQLMRTDFEVCETWLPPAHPPLDCALTAYIGMDDPMVPQALMKDWSALCNTHFKMEIFDGGHFYLTGYKRELVQSMMAGILEHYN